MSDDRIEGEVRAWLASRTEDRVPDSLRAFLLDLPGTQPPLGRVQPRLVASARIPRRELAIALVAVIVIAIGASLAAGLGSWRPIKPPSSIAVQSNGPTTAPTAVPTSPPALTPPVAGPYGWTLVSSTGELATYSVGPVIRRRDGTLLAVGVAATGQPKMLTSADGRTWTIEAADPGLTQAAALHVSIVSGLAEGPSGFVAVGATALDDISSGDARAWISADGVHWLAAASSGGMADAEMESVTAGPDGFVAVGIDGFPGGNTQLPSARGAAVWRSSDGRTWSRLPWQKSFDGAVMFGVRRTSSGYIAWGEIHNTTAASLLRPPIWTSTDGLLWNRAIGVFDAGWPAPIQSIVAIGDRLIASGSRQVSESGATISVPAIWLSSDGGRSWTLANTPEAPPARPSPGAIWNVGVSGSDLLAVGRHDPPLGPSTSPAFVTGSAFIWHSTDRGFTWTALPDDPTFAGTTIKRVVGTDGGFVAFGSPNDPNAVADTSLIWVGLRQP
jgi:hypothetical protein